MNLAVAHIIYTDDESYQAEAQSISKRFTLANEILAEISASHHNVDLLIFPAGYLVSTQHDKCTSLATNFVDNLEAREYIIAFGINHIESHDETSQGSYDYSHGFVVGPGGQKYAWMVNQLGIGSADRIQFQEITADRLFNVAGYKVGLLLCGEMNTIVKDIKGTPRMSEYLAKDADLLIDLTHADRQITPSGMSWFPSMERTGQPCVVAENILDGYLDNTDYCHDAKIGIDYSHMLDIIESKMTKYYNLIIYSTTQDDSGG